MGRRKNSRGGLAIDAFLKRSGWTQRQLSQAAGVDDASISRVRLGRREITAATALALARGTAAAREAGLLTCEPLTLEALVPELAPPVALPPTGT
jgi:transcriptional regulator with XRE-family HTH domain